MKQHITLEQFIEIPEIDQRKLAKQFNIYLGGIVKGNQPDFDEGMKWCKENWELGAKDYNILSIGQMVEFLEGHLTIDHLVFGEGDRRWLNKIYNNKVDNKFWLVAT